MVIRAAAVLGIAAAVLGTGMGGCSSKPKTATLVSGATIELERLEGEWTDGRGTIVEIEHEGKQYEIEVEQQAGAFVPDDADLVYPMKLVRSGSTTIAEVEASRTTENGTQAVAMLYGQIAVEGDVLRFRRLKSNWLGTRGDLAEDVKVTPLQGGRVALATGDAGALRRLLDAATADDGAWDAPEIWTRVTASPSGKN
ncbi:MAG: hypothetical protein SFZ23_15475 [Planctomycetota bacterium]|nr:hypothetical protein [Planctomycetota bacterium]